MLLLQILLGVAILFWGYALVILWVDAHRTPAVRTDAAMPEPAPLVSVVLPARNEEFTLARCLGSLSGQDYPHLEVIVVNDRSEDRTGEIAREWAGRDPRIQVFDGVELAEGWLGKNWANYQGVEQARGDWLLFTDADTWHHPASVRGSMSLARQLDLDAVTLGPFLECLTFWEKVFQPAMFAWILIFLPAFLINRPTFPRAMANGQYFLIRRDIYEEIGGHQAIRERMADDMALAEKIKHRGRRILIVDGLDVLRTRMYVSLKDIWQGWSKNLMAGLGNRFTVIAALIALLLISSVLPFLVLGLSLAGVVTGTSVLVLSALASGLLLGVRATGLLRFELSPLYALLHPLAALLLIAILVNSAVRSRSRLGVAWKGRIYQRPQ